ncbi:MAG: hypothetical protein OQJ89_14835 [Kangiellaceae bacterium]|nr:hypothetical protein [Kangiellaceae bacterium]MCW9018244.1 hypothetical protein [Kangiellaceae bacterium]
MKYLPFASLEVAKFKSMLKTARVLGFASIAGFYLTLIIAASYYFGILSANGSALTPALIANEILVVGISACVVGLGLSALLAYTAVWQDKVSQVG